MAGAMPKLVVGMAPHCLQQNRIRGMYGYPHQNARSWHHG